MIILPSVACPVPTDDDPSLVRVDPRTGLPQILESTYVRHLSENIGYRTVGTTEHTLTDKWMVDTAYEIREESE